MHRFYVSPEDARGAEITLPRAEAHHAVRVLRLRAGDRAVVLDGAGGVLVCEALMAQKREARMRVLERRTVPPPPWRLTLVQAVCKGRAMDLIIQKAAELGAARIVPVLTERTVSHLDDERAESRLAKWRQAAIEAIKQCGSAWLPNIEAPMPMSQWLARGEVFDLALVASLRGGAQHPRALIEQYRSRHQRAPVNVAVWIGPEGDFTPEELGAIQSAGAAAITLGSLTLRAETAAIYCLAVLDYELSAAERWA